MRLPVRKNRFLRYAQDDNYLWNVFQGKKFASDEENKKWCARRDSNSRPNAPEAFALSS
jgi:hypothetical protein